MYFLHLLKRFPDRRNSQFPDTISHGKPDVVRHSDRNLRFSGLISRGKPDVVRHSDRNMRKIEMRMTLKLMFGRKMGLKRFGYGKTDDRNSG